MTNRKLLKKAVQGRVRSVSRTLAVGAVALAAAVMVAACGSSSSTTSTSSSSGGGSSTQTTGATQSSSVTVDGQKISTDPKLAGEVPAKVRQQGALTDITYNNAPPDESIVGGALVGWEVDLGQAVAAELGLKWQPTASGAFDSFIPGLQNGRFNSSFTSFIQTPARLKQIDIVTYYNVGTGFAVKAGNSLAIKAPTDLCGHSVAVIEGSAFIQQLQGIKCSAAAKPAVKVQSFPSDSAAELAVSSGRSEVYSSSADQLSWLISKAAHQFVLQPLDYMPVPEGAGVTKGSGLAKPIADAMDKLIQSGVYKAVMNKYSITEGLVDKATVYSDTKS